MTYEPTNKFPNIKPSVKEVHPLLDEISFWFCTRVVMSTNSFNYDLFAKWSGF